MVIMSVSGVAIRIISTAEGVQMSNFWRILLAVSCTVLVAESAYIGLSRLLVRSQAGEVNSIVFIVDLLRDGLFNGLLIPRGRYEDT
jgi:hypothetical protein